MLKELINERLVVAQSRLAIVQDILMFQAQLTAADREMYITRKHQIMHSIAWYKNQLEVVG